MCKKCDKIESSIYEIRGMLAILNFIYEHNCGGYSEGINYGMEFTTKICYSKINAITKTF